MREIISNRLGWILLLLFLLAAGTVDHNRNRFPVVEVKYTSIDCRLAGILTVSWFNEIHKYSWQKVRGYRTMFNIKDEGCEIGIRIPTEDPPTSGPAASIVASYGNNSDRDTITYEINGERINED